jgi:hypothetical protein
MIEGVVKVYCDGEVVARVKCGSGGRMAFLEAGTEGGADHGA